MLNISKENKGAALIVRLAGSIDESTYLDKLIGPPAPEMHVICKEVTRINSVGVKNWIKYFAEASAKGSKVKFLECSSVLVEQMNMISNFTANFPVESLYVPFACSKCKTELVGLFKTADIKKLNGVLPELKCTKCGGVARFDDIPEEYFGFLNR